MDISVDASIERVFTGLYENLTTAEILGHLADYNEALDPECVGYRKVAAALRKAGKRIEALEQLL